MISRADRDWYGTGFRIPHDIWFPSVCCAPFPFLYSGKTNGCCGGTRRSSEHMYIQRERERERERERKREKEREKERGRQREKNEIQRDNRWYRSMPHVSRALNPPLLKTLDRTCRTSLEGGRRGRINGLSLLGDKTPENLLWKRPNKT